MTASLRRSVDELLAHCEGAATTVPRAALQALADGLAGLERRFEARTAALAESEARLRSIFLSASDAILVAEPATRALV